MQRCFDRLLVLVALVTTFGCSHKLANQVARSNNAISVTAISGDTLRLDLIQSMVKWKGTALGGISKHTGVVKLSKGYLLMRGDSIVGGRFVMDVNSFEPTDIKSKAMKRKFIKHMRSNDFFNTDLYPISTFVITKATADSISGNFTLRDVIKNISFKYIPVPFVPYELVGSDNPHRINEYYVDFVIDKSDWNVPYKKVNDLVEIEVGLVQKNR